VQAEGKARGLSCDKQEALHATGGLSRATGRHARRHSLPRACSPSGAPGRVVACGWRVRRGTGTNQGIRHHALLAALLGSGLRVSEMLHLERDPYTGKGFTNVQTKGGVIRDFVPVHREARQVLDEWLEARQDDSPALFLTRTGRKLSRREAYGIICRVAAQANAHLPEDEKIDVSPHVLRHTFLRKLAETKGVHYAREASGHQSDRYIWRYVKPDQQTLADAIDELE
jgi:integrase/recombinase XerD